MKAIFLAVLLGACLPGIGAAEAEVRESVVSYRSDDAVLEGFLTYDDSSKDRRPGILVVHDWMGISEDTKERARMLAGLGFVALAADIYGKGVRPSNASEAGKIAGAYKADTALMRSRANAALRILMKNDLVDQRKLAAIGYCFGGTVALELARSGAPLQATVSFHGGLSTKNASDASNIKGSVLVLHGADDPFVKAEEVAAFENEMRQGRVDWTLVKYSGAVHAFTVRGAGSDPSKGAAYNEKADRRSWLAMKDFFDEIFSKP